MVEDDSGRRIGNCLVALPELERQGAIGSVPGLESQDR
jgi:hypothetical protein